MLTAIQTLQTIRCIRICQLQHLIHDKTQLMTQLLMASFHESLTNNHQLSDAKLMHAQHLHREIKVLQAELDVKIRQNLFFPERPGAQ